MSIPILAPLNDCAFVVQIKKVNSAGTMVALDAGSGTAFIADNDAPTATSIDNTLEVTPTYTGANGKWLVEFDAALLLPALLASAFATATPYCIIQFTNGVRIAVELHYQAIKTVQPA